jgi:tetratricopeptide (TPR) repeat protein
MAVHSSGVQVESLLALLRSEEPLEQDTTQQAILHHECGVLEEARGDEAAAAREHLAAYNSEPDFREPLEALVRLYGRKREDRSLPKLLESLVDAARSPGESARALWELAGYRQQVENDLVQARSCLEAAVETSANDAACWLELELVAAKQNDVEARIRARDARQNLVADPTWQGLLLVELAEICAEASDMARAASLLDTVVALDGRARFRSRLVLEDLARRASDAELMAHALEGQAELIAQALEDPEVAERSGIPRLMCTPEQAADAWVRAGELRRRAGDAWGAVAALSAAAQRVEGDGLVARLRIAAADATGDEAAAVDIAREQLARGVDGPAGASLWLRLARAAEQEQDDDKALRAYDKALDLDPDNVVALTLRTDLLAAGADASALATAIEAEARVAGSQAAQARQHVTAAYVWSVRAGDMERGQRSLERALELGLPGDRMCRIARTLASLSGDPAWYADATRQLLELVNVPSERAALYFELGRARLLSGDDAGALEAFAMLAASGDGGTNGDAWLGRVLAAYAVGVRPDGEGAAAPAREKGVLLDLARVEPEAQLARGLVIVAAMAAAREGRLADALELLHAEHRRDPGDVAVALCLADLERGRGNVELAATTLSSCAGALQEPALAGSLQLEAGLLLWRAGERRRAVEAFEEAVPYAPDAAHVVLSWALKAAAPDDLDGRRRAADLADDIEADRAGAALERFGIAVASGDRNGGASAALEHLDELEAGGDLAVAGALGRLLVGGEPALIERALDRLEELGGAAASLVRAERYRQARFVARDGEAALRAARLWGEEDGSRAALLEWLSAAYAADNREAEIDARRAFASQLEGELAIAIDASAALMDLVHRPADAPTGLASRSELARLVNLELTPPGAEPARRSIALRAAGAALGESAVVQADRMAAWSDLASGAHADAQDAFLRLVRNDPEDVASWEGFQLASERVGDYESAGKALAHLGNLCDDDGRGAEMWERAGLVLLEHTDAHDDAEIAFERALERDRSRAVAFDKLFRRVRARNEDDKLLELIDMRLEFTEDTAEMTKMYWERARVLRRKGDDEGALGCLKDVTMLEPDHVGALALAGEISIHRGDFDGAAPLLARLATLKDAPQKQRLLSAVAAVDLYEKKLNQPERALEVLSRLYQDGLSTLKVRERLARTAARLGRWDEAASILERLMDERDTPKGRAEAARLAMTIYRDKLAKPERAQRAVRRLLQEAPDDREAVQLLMRAHVSDELKRDAVPRAKTILIQELATHPFDRERVELLAEIAQDEGDSNLRRAALGVALALGNRSETITRALANLDARAVREPQIVLDAHAILAVCDQDDTGPIAELFAQLAPVVSQALGPNLTTEAVGRRQRIEGGDPLRMEITRWMGAVGFSDWELYIGGREERGVKGVAGERPALIVGPAVRAPLDSAGRSAVAREVFALRRGTTAVMYCDDHTIASIVVSAMTDAGLPAPEPPYAVYREVERLVHKEMPRKIRKVVAAIGQRILQTQQDPLPWAAAARRSIDRMALIASGDAASVIDHIVGPPGVAARADMSGDIRVRRLLAFTLSGEYLALRRKLGMGVV